MEVNNARCCLTIAKQTSDRLTCCESSLERGQTGELLPFTFSVGSMVASSIAVKFELRFDKAFAATLSRSELAF